jgi:anti-sigma factor RsiW
MICREFTPDLVDHARGVALDPLRVDALTRHLQSCASCRAVFERERAMSSALRRLADAQPAPAANDAQLQKLLASFDVPRQRQQRVRVAVEWSLAASVLIVAGLAAGWKNDAPAPRPSQVAATPAGAANSADFVVLPGAEGLPQFEHGQVIQVDIPSAGGVVHAEVLIGQDGLARAARLAQ